MEWRRVFGPEGAGVILAAAVVAGLVAWGETAVKLNMVITLVIGVATLLLWRGQIKLGKDLGEKQLRAVWWEKKYEAMEGVREFVGRVLRGHRFTGQDIWRLLVETKGREYLYQGTKVEGWLEGFYEKAQALATVDCIVEGDKKDDFLTNEKRKAMRKKRTDLYDWFEGAAGELHELLKEELGMGG